MSLTAYADTQVLDRAERDRALAAPPPPKIGVLDARSIEEAHYRIDLMDHRMNSLEQKVDTVLSEQAIAVTLVQDIVRRQGRVEMSLDTLTGFVKTNCELVQSLLGREATHKYRRQIIEALALVALALSCAGTIALVAKVY